MPKYSVTNFQATGDFSLQQTRVMVFLFHLLRSLSLQPLGEQSVIMNKINSLPPVIVNCMGKNPTYYLDYAFRFGKRFKFLVP